jgi:hypothetical protein
MGFVMIIAPFGKQRASIHDAFLIR